MGGYGSHKACCFSYGLIFIGILYIGNICEADVLPSYTNGRFVSEIVWVVDVQVGTISKPVKAVIDRSGHKLITTFTLDRTTSKTYSTLAGGSDVVLIGEQDVIFEHEVNPTLPSLYGCSSCSAVLGVGSGSPIWLHFNKVLYTPGGILLDETTDSFDYLSGTYGYVDCMVATSNMCVAQGIYKGTTVNVVFGGNQVETLLPGPLLDEYIDGKSLRKNPPEDWSSITIKFPSIPGTGGRNELTIQRHHIVAPSEDSNHILLVGKSPSDDTIYIGRAARLNVMIQVEKVNSRAVIVSIQTSKHYSIGGMLAGVLLAVVWAFWRQSPQTSWQQFNFSSPYKIASIAIIVICSVVFYSAEVYQASLSPLPVVNTYIGVLMFSMIIWNIGVILIYFTSSSRDILGWVMEERVIKTKESKSKDIEKDKGTLTVNRSNFINGDEESNSEGDVSFPSIADILVPDEYGVETPRSFKKNRGIPKRKQAKSRNGNILIDDLLGKLEVPKPENSPVAKYERVYFNTRLWVLASVFVEITILANTFLVFTETRAESLWGLAPMFIMLYILYKLVYNLFIVATLGKGKRSLVWSGFIVYLLVVIAATLVVSQKYIVGPTVERLLVSEEFLAIFGSTTLYLVMTYWAVWSGVNSVLLEEKKRAAFYETYSARSE